jgi:DNA-binding CsgD family transcriptional regulator
MAGMTITGRQLVCLSLAADGHTLDQIAAKMYISQSTAKTCLHRARTALGAHTTAHAVALAYQTGLLGDTASVVANILGQVAGTLGYDIALLPRERS